jgi:hypothetical protein
MRHARPSLAISSLTGDAHGAEKKPLGLISARETTSTGTVDSDEAHALIAL